ncbi:hypothetical protein Tco_0804789 [Tanacetum coccineum]|uniref:Uncharacterized protein n=1 Tax=Tanacetum coccineum TaxID=301880 RepID=A0ABQ5A8C9_9ASTR
MSMASLHYKEETNWWFKEKEFYINKHSEPSDREAVRSQMQILSVISVKKKDFRNLSSKLILKTIPTHIFKNKLNHLPKTAKPDSKYYIQHVDKKTCDQKRGGRLTARD